MLKDLKLLVPEGWKNIPYAWESLKAFDVQFEIIPVDYHLFIDHLIMPETRKWTFSFQPQIIKEARIRMLEYALNFSTKNDGPKKIYLTRSKRGVRCAENEADVMNLLSNYGYTSVSFEDLSIWEQIVLMNQTTHLISIHGAGLSNLMFMQPNSCVLELINRPYAHAEYTFPFWKLANTIDLNYYMQLCDVVNEQDAKLSFGKNKGGKDETYLVNTNLIVDLKLLKLNVKLMEKTR
jgi:capsular polysaccharide biosynthesis protein